VSHRCWSLNLFNNDKDTHFAIAMYAIERGMHVLVTKPAVQTLQHHNELIAAAKKHDVVCFVEHHKRSVFR
jgi:D-galacturonate reductase